jgi:hypothetical protein
MKAIRPWPAKTECPEPEFVDFKAALSRASFHNAADNSSEWKHADSHVAAAAAVADTAGWPYWAMKRMFSEIGPMVAWDSFMQAYINLLKKDR